MKISVALEKIHKPIIDKVGTDTKIVEILKEMSLIDIIKSFSVPTSQKAIKAFNNSKAPTAMYEIDSYLDALAKELIRLGTEANKICSCGADLRGHIYVYFLLYLQLYMTIEFPAESAKALKNLIDSKFGVVHDFLKYRPSQN